MELFVVRPWTKTNKRVCIVRYGAWGDAIMMSPVLRKYKEEGWHVTLNCTEKCFEILRTNPYIDAFIVQKSNEIPMDKLEDHWKKLKRQFDKLVNLSGSVENSLLISPGQKEYTWNREKMAKRCNKNYYDNTMALAGFKKETGLVGEMHFTKNEENFGKRIRKKYKGFLVLWCLSGSSIHKIYPYAENVLHAIADGIPGVRIILIGEPGCKGLVSPHKRIIDKCGEIGIREGCVLTKYVDLVVSPETSILNAVGCFDTPKIAILSHSSQENLTKYFRSCYNIVPEVPCYPCHKLHYTRDTCPLNKDTNHPICMALLHPLKILNPIEKVYIAWKQNHL